MGKQVYPAPVNDFAKNSSEMKIPSQYDNKDYGKDVKAVPRKVTVKSSGKDGKVYGVRAIMTKEDQVLIRPTFKDHLLQEASDLSQLPDIVFKELKSNISKGAKDLDQKWKNALELTYKAYQVAGVRRPLPSEKMAWKQFEELLAFSVRSLSATRGLDGDWRTSNVLVKEAAQPEQNHIGKRRFFVEVPGESAQEVDGANMDEIIEAITNKIRNDRTVKGTKVRIEERTKKYAILTIWVNDIKRDRIIIKEVS